MEGGHGRNQQVSAYMNAAPPKHHELRMLDLMVNRLGSSFDGDVLDIGCAAGVFLHRLRREMPNATLRGIDLSTELIALARERATGDIEFEVADAAAYSPPRPVDAIHASGMLSIFEDPLPVLDLWLSWLKEGGHLFVFGRFNSDPIDTRVLFRSHHRGDGVWEGGLTSYWTGTVERHLQARGWKCEFERFEVPIDLPKSDDPIRTYTCALADGGKVVVNGANIIAEHHFLAVTR